MSDPTTGVMVQFFVGGLVRRLFESPAMSIGVTGLVVAWYLRRGVGVASSGAAIAGTAVTYTVVVIVLGSVATMFGWITPDPSAAANHLTTLLSLAQEHLVGFVVDRGRALIDGVLP